MRPRIARRGAILVCCLFLALAATIPRAECWHREAPRLVNYYLRSDIGDHLPLLAQWDLLIVPYYTLHTDPGSLAALKELNPQQRILAYIDPMCISQCVVGGPGDLHYDFHAGIDSLWIAYTEQGDTIVFWSSTIHVNITERCPLVGGERYRDYFVRFLDERLSPRIDDGTIDGVFLDEMSNGGYLWWDPQFEGSFDYDLDGVPDDPDSLAVWLTNAIDFLAESSAAVRPPGSVLLANNCKPFQPALNGKFFEAFPATWEGGLEGTLNTLDFWNAYCTAPHVSGVNGIPSDPNNQRQFRYRFAGSLLADCYFSYDYSTSAHYQLDWFDLFDTELGLPAGGRFILGEEPVLLADFEAGLDSCVLDVPWVSEMRITEDPDLVLAGQRSLHVWPINTAGWPALLELRLPDGWQAGEHYIFSFLYRVMSCPPEGSFMQVKAQMSACPAVATSNQALLPGAVGSFRGDLELGDCWDYTVYLRVEGDVSLVLDSLAVVAGEPGIWARDYEGGRVVCNTTSLPRPLPYDPSLVLADGDGQHQHYPGWQAGQAISVWPGDGLVFLRCDPVDQVLLNELLCRNESVLPDEAGDHDPWLELYNAGPLDAPLGGLQLALPRADGARWCLPDTMLPPDSHFLVWCDAEPQEGPLHADFALPVDSGTVLLLDAAGAALDSCHFPPQMPDTSWGRLPDGGPNWCFMAPTPGATNSSATAAGTGAGALRLLPCHPNPFNPATRITFVTPRPGRVRLDLLDVAGRRVAVLVDGDLPAGDHAVDWRGVDDRGRRLPSGLYVARLRCGGREDCARLLLLR